MATKEQGSAQKPKGAPTQLWHPVLQKLNFFSCFGPGWGWHHGCWGAKGGWPTSSLCSPTSLDAEVYSPSTGLAPGTGSTLSSESCSACPPEAGPTSPQRAVAEGLGRAGAGGERAAGHQVQWVRTAFHSKVSQVLSPAQSAWPSCRPCLWMHRGLPPSPHHTGRACHPSRKRTQQMAVNHTSGCFLGRLQKTVLPLPG